MGKATIASGGADGLYQVKLDYGNATKTARLAAIDARLAALVGLIAQSLQDLNTQEYTAAQVEAEVESAINAYVAAAQALGALASDADAAVLKALQDAVNSTLKNHADALNKQAEAVRKMAPLRLAWQALKAEQVQLQKDQAKWTALTLTETVPAWCADLTEDASGEVAIIEIPGESKLVLIAPAAPAPLSTDGLLTAREVQSPEQVFWNAAVLPGWQKFKPTYRRGTVTAVYEGADTVDVTLDADLSSAQALVINQAATLSGVPVQYMTCHSAAFTEGDKCVVKFTGQDWAQPKVVGFVDHPKSCGGNLYLLPWSAYAATGYPVDAPSSFWPRVLKAAAPVALIPFNPPNSSLGHHPGATSWCNPDIKLGSVPVVLSWRGPDYRYSPCTDWFPVNMGNPFLGHLQQLGQGLPPFIDSSYIWVNGKILNTPVYKIIAAALHRPEPVDKPERIILRLFTDYYSAGPGAERTTAFYDVERAGASAEDTVLTIAGLLAGDALAVTGTYPGPVYSAPGWRSLAQRPHFNKSGTAVVGICVWNAFYKPFTLAVSAPGAPVLMEIAEVESSATNSQSEDSQWAGAPTWTGTTNSFATISETEVKQTFYAADFLGDVPVALYTQASWTRVTTSSGTYEATFGPPDGSAPLAVFEAYANTNSTVTISDREIRLIHTLHGDLKTKVYSGSIGAQTSVLHTENGFFCGDLSRDMICFGLAESDITYSQDSISPVQVKTVTRYNPRYLLEFWFKNPENGFLSKSVHAVLGGYHFSGSTEPYVWAVYPAVTDAGFYRGPLTNFSGFTSGVRNQTEAATWYWPFQHAGADPLGRVAYFGAGQYQQGANVLIRVADDTLVNVPAYAPGGYPNTAMAPIIF